MKHGAAPTRLELLRARRLLARVDRGTALLRRKREALVRELFPLARPAAQARRAIAAAAEAGYRAQLEAIATHGEPAVAATGRPPRDITVDLDVHRVWGAAVPALSDLPAWDRGLAARATGPTATGPAQFAAANQFERMASLILDAARRELLLRALGGVLARTSRQLHTLEHRIAPQLNERITRVARALDEREREEHARLRQLRAKRANR